MHWRIYRPATSDYWREASCDEVSCRNYLGGWRTIIPIDDIGNIHWVRQSGMDVREEPGDGLITFHFAPGQRCFDGRLGRHRVPLERDPVMALDGIILEPLEYMDQWNDYHYRRR
jgi:hypothetical protein